MPELTEAEARARVVEATLTAMRASDPDEVAAATRERRAHVEALTATRQRRRDRTPTPPPDTSDAYRPLVVAAVGRLSAALDLVEQRNAELDALLDQAKTDHAPRAVDGGLVWPEFGTVDRPDRESRLKRWRRFVAANGWTPPSARATSELTLRVRADTRE